MIKVSDLNLEWSGQGSVHIQKHTNIQTEPLISELGTIV